MPTAPPPLLSPEHLIELNTAHQRRGKLQRAAGVATFNGWTIGTFALLTTLCGISSPTSLVLGAGMAVVAFVEFRGAARLRRLDVAATRLLGFNQLALASLLILYAIWQIIGVLHDPSSYSQLLGNDRQLLSMLGPIEETTRQILLTVYGVMIAVVLLFQGGNALYYFSRGEHFRAYLRDTPAWILDLQRAGVRL